MSIGTSLNEEQDEQRLEGLRVLARIIARHYLNHPELYPEPDAGGLGSGADARRPGGRNKKVEDKKHGT